MTTMTYNACKKIIDHGGYDEDDMRSKLDLFLLGDRITEEQYKYLIGQINKTNNQ